MKSDIPYNNLEAWYIDVDQMVLFACLGSRWQCVGFVGRSPRPVYSLSERWENRPSCRHPS